MEIHDFQYQITLGHRIKVLNAKTQNNQSGNSEKEECRGETHVYVDLRTLE